MAAMFTSEVNTAQAEGLTYSGQQGTNLFTRIADRERGAHTQHRQRHVERDHHQRVAAADRWRPVHADL